MKQKETPNIPITDSMKLKLHGKEFDYVGYEGAGIFFKAQTSAKSPKQTTKTKDRGNER